MKTVSLSLSGIFFWFFVIVKVSGHVFAAWSWWWIFLPIVPVLSLFVQRLGL